MVLTTAIQSFHRRKIGLSIRKLEETSEKPSYNSYLNSHGAGATSNLGELLKEEMMNLQRHAVPEDEEPSATLEVEEETSKAEPEPDMAPEPEETPAAEPESDIAPEPDENPAEVPDVSLDKPDQASN